MIQCFKVIDEYGSPVQNARVDVIVGREKIYSNFTSPTGQVNATVQEGDNLVYVRFGAYTPSQYVYNGSGSEACITITIKTCVSLRQEPLDEGRFLRWMPVMYCAREQTLPLEICGKNRMSDDPVCDRYDDPYDEDYYPLPVKNGDVIKWVMESSEVDYDGDNIEDLRIGITQEGVMVAEDVGTITELDGQLFCEATIPCLKDCEYEFVVYRKDVIDYIGVIVTPPSSPEACDGQIQAVVELGTPPYEYSLDEETWQLSDTFTGLCQGEYIVYARDSDCSQAEKPAYLQDIDCSVFEGKTLGQVIAMGVTLGQVLDCTLCDFAPSGQGFSLGPNLVLGFLSGTWFSSGATLSSDYAQLFGSGAYVENTFTSTSSTIRMSVRITEIYSAGWTVKLMDSTSTVVYTRSGSNWTIFDEVLSLPSGDYTIRFEKTGDGRINVGRPIVSNATTC